MFSLNDAYKQAIVKFNMQILRKTLSSLDHVVQQLSNISLNLILEQLQLPLNTSVLM